MADIKNVICVRKKPKQQNETFKCNSSFEFDAIQFHVDDAVPNINDMNQEDIIEETKKVKALLDKYDLKVKFVTKVKFYVAKESTVVILIKIKT